jgi:DNA-binding winged helix-turn-helix (wHTH) protein/tetratricopeptide (TPR) repeat protein
MNDLHFGEFTLSVARRQLRRHEEVVALPGKAFDLLVYMAENPGRLLPKSELMSAVWPDSFVEESNITQNVSLIRRALGPADEAAIATIPGRGYQFTAAVARVPLASPGVPLSDPQPHTATLEATRSRVLYEETTEERIDLRRSPLAMTLVGTGVLLAAACAWLGWQRWEDHVGGPPVQAVVTDLDGTTGDPVLDRTLNSLFRIELAQSPFVSVVSTATVRRTLTQMLHKPDDPLTLELARDLCQRTDSQTVLRGSAARAGKGFVLTEEAFNCVDGATLASATQKVGAADDLPRAVGKLAATLRHSLGESRRTIARYDKPLAPETTGSLDALKDYTQGAFLGQQGHFPEAIDLLKQAVAIDPKFAAAWLDLANFSANALNPTAARPYLIKAYENREFATEPARLYIIARYQSQITGDLYASLRDYQAWANLYPRSPQPWSGLADVNWQLGNHKDQLVAAQHLLQLVPNNSAAYQGLADAQLRNGDFAAARATCELAIHRNFDGQGFRNLLLRLGHLTHDQTLIAEQEAWADAHPDSPILLANLAAYAQNEGRMKDAEKLFDRLTEAFNKQGAPEAAARIRQGISAAYNGLGEPDLARKALHLAPIDPTDINALSALVETGDTAIAAKYLNGQLAAEPQSTLWNLYYAPLLRGDIDIVTNKPQDAIAQLESVRPFDGIASDGFYLRGRAYMDANQLPRAEAEFRALLNHPEVEPNAYQLPLAQLQLARVLARENNVPASIQAYETFLQVWAHADPDQKLLKRVNAELAVEQAKSKL